MTRSLLIASVCALSWGLPGRENSSLAQSVVVEAGVTHSTGTSRPFVPPAAQPIVLVPVAASQQPTDGELASRGIEYLRSTQAPEGYWTEARQLGITALCVTGLLHSGVPATDPTVQRAFAYLESFIQPDGGIYHPDSTHKNYETAIAILAFRAAEQAGPLSDKTQRAVTFLKDLQWNQKDGLDPSDPAFGGAGYGRSQRPDMSNTQYFLDALVAAGVSRDDPAFRDALTFVSRCQNLESEHNQTPFAAKINDGGFYYTPAAGGSSMAGTNPDGGLRSYASMTYAGLKSMIYAGLTADDPRVAAAMAWLKDHYTLDENPGTGQQGLFYYYHTVAKTMHVLGADQFVAADGTAHDWRAELRQQLAAKQNANGSWTNPTDRWAEGDANLVTAYVLLTLREISAQ